MSDSQRFRGRLAARILALVGGAAAVPLAACNYDYSQLPGGDCGGGGGSTSSAGTGTTSSSTTSSGTTSSSTTSSSSGTTACFNWQAGTSCPPPEVALVDFDCPAGWGPVQILAAAPATGDTACCYVVALGVCGAVGRPWVVDDRPLVAPTQRGAGSLGWSLASPPLGGDLTPSQRASLAEAWTADALLEHASVASFARSSLALLAAGAPAHLVELSHRAALDEVRHARLCFALASTYAGEDVAPGPFPLGGDVRVEATLEAIAVSTVHEGCLGETVAAVIAAEQLARATDPRVRAALTEIAADEARHSELAWRIVAWAVDAGGPPVRAAVERALQGALAAACAAPEPPPQDAARDPRWKPTAASTQGPQPAWSPQRWPPSSVPPRGRSSAGPIPPIPGRRGTRPRFVLAWGMSARTAAALIAATIALTGCGGAAATGPDGAVVLARIDERLHGAWRLLDYRPATPLDPMSQAFIAFQLNTLTVRLENGRIHAESPGLHVNRAYRLHDGYGNQFKLTSFDAQGVSYNAVGTFVRPDVLEISSWTDPWRGVATFQKVGP